MIRITSRQNAVVSQYRAAAAGDDRQRLLLDGSHLVAEALEAGTVIRHAIVATDELDAAPMQTLVQRLERHDVEIAAGSSSVMGAVSPVRSFSPIVALADRPAPGDQRMFERPSPLVVVACDVQDPGNIGAIVRVAEAAGASGLIAAGACADPFSWKALRGSMGSALRLPIALRTSIDQAVADARARNCRVIATTPRDGRTPYDVDLTGAVAILIGAEGAGLPQSALDASAERVAIPMQRPVESLNAAVTAGLLVYEARRQRSHSGSSIA